MANVQIIGLAHAMFNGARGDAGGAPSKDSIVGVVLIQGNVVTFGGRRGGKLKFHTHKKANLEAVMARYNKKLTGNPFGKNVDARYSEVAADLRAELLGAEFETTISKGFYKAMANKQLNINTRKAKAA